MIRIEGLRHHLLDVPSLIAKEGRVAVIGPNGAGKTTLLELLSGMDKPREGTVEVMGRRPELATVGWVGEFPDHTMLFSRVFDEVASSLRFLKVPVDVADRRTRATMGMLGRPDLLLRGTGEISGGEKALVALAAALAPSPDLLVLDEVDSHLDEASSRLIRETVLSSDQRAVYCTQDMDHAAAADLVLYIDGGRVMLRGPPEEVFASLEGTCFYPSMWRLRR